MNRLTCGALWATSLAVALATAGCSSTIDAGGTGPIKVASLVDETGALSGYGLPMDAAAKLAVEDINAHGGVLGRKLELDTIDGQSDVARYTLVARKLAKDPSIAVVQGGVSSASREAIRPIFDAAKKLYFYNLLYEGGVCDRNTFVTGQTPSQQLAPLLKWTADSDLTKWYVLAPDYNYGQISANWVKAFAKQYGATIVGGPTFFDLTNSDFTSQIPKIQASGADAVVSLLVGPAHLNFYKQWSASGLNQTTTIVSPTFGLSGDQTALGAGAKGIMTAYPYFESLDTDASRAFVDMWHKAGRTDAVTPGAVDTWNGWQLWAKAVEAAGSLDSSKVAAALESGLSVDGPSGQVSMDPGSHHTIVPMRLWKADGKGGFELDEQLTDAAPPLFEQEKCDLTNDPSVNEQFTP